MKKEKNNFSFKKGVAAIKNNFFRGRFFVVMLFILAFVAGVILNILVDGGTTPPQHLAGIILTPIQSGATSVKNYIDDFFETMDNYDALKQENEQLRTKLTELENKVEDNYMMQTENDRLRGLLGLKELYPSYEFVQADIVSIAPGALQSSFSINKGTIHGIAKKDIVVASDGLVGYVKEVGLYWARVVTIIDPQVAAGAVVARTGDIAMTEGSADLKEQGLCKLAYIKNTAVINRGDLVNTSGLGGVYPEGLRIGKITSIVVEDSGLSQYAVITPSVDFTELKSVFIISNFEVDEEKPEE